MDNPANRAPATRLDHWTTDELLEEVLDRSEGDRSALDRIRALTLRALLNDCDQKFGATRGAI